MMSKAAASVSEEASSTSSGGLGSSLASTPALWAGAPKGTATSFGWVPVGGVEAEGVFLLWRVQLDTAVGQDWAGRTCTIFDNFTISAALVTWQPFLVWFWKFLWGVYTSAKPEIMWQQTEWYIVLYSSKYHYGCYESLYITVWFCWCIVICVWEKGVFMTISLF